MANFKTYYGLKIFNFITQHVTWLLSENGELIDHYKALGERAIANSDRHTGTDLCGRPIDHFFEMAINDSELICVNDSFDQFTYIAIQGDGRWYDVIAMDGSGDGYILEKVEAINGRF